MKFGSFMCQKLFNVK